MSTHPSFPKADTFLPLDQAVKIKCRFCDLADICHRRSEKEAFEEDGMITRCTMTPNRPGKKRKANKKKRKK